ncbi:pyrophosphatase PpaX [Bacillus massiliigorillae]|uniref:pyrophosphatase PpaX n=1 Tax=Bacillus massiliigorillae TaxID=1243664 RepID=UPI00039B467F|nr:pyrophosphatase PpaX [Bacillus massiliigorillae]
MSRNINTVLFDLDGTLINTIDLILASFTETLNHFYPNEYSREDMLKFIGPPLVDSFRTVDENRVDEMVTYYREYNMKNHDALVKEYDGVLETVEALQEAGFKIGIVTTKLRAAVLKGLKIGKLEPFFDVIVTLDDVQNAKPDPEPINKALEQLHAKPGEAIMVGDSSHDILAGQNAGTLTAGVAWTVQGREHLETFKPDYMLENMKDLLRILKVE